MREHVYFTAAADMARQGASRGMIVQMLRKQHVDEAAAQSVADSAMQSEATRRRWIGSATSLVGLAIIAAGLYSWFWIQLPRLPLAIAMLGLFIFGVGFSNVLGPLRGKGS